MCISALFVGEILLTVQMVLKQAAGPAAAAAISVIPTYLFRKATKERFLRSFEDAALLQTSLLDGWDTGADYSIEKREEFRQFLVDAHKAAYVSESIVANVSCVFFISYENGINDSRFQFAWQERILMIS